MRLTMTMWSSPKLLTTLSFLILILILYLTTPHYILNAQAQIHDFSSFDFSSSMSSIIISDNIDDDQIISTDDGKRRSLYYWRRKAYYISYGALSANRVPCPARSGRSYYTHNCFRARGPANPYHRGCSCIARCRR